jgi:hypothetical protein
VDEADTVLTTTSMTAVSVSIRATMRLNSPDVIQRMIGTRAVSWLNPTW